VNEHNPQPVDAALVPRFGAIPTFMRLPHVTDPARLAEARAASWQAARTRWHWEHQQERGALLAAVASVLS